MIVMVKLTSQPSYFSAAVQEFADVRLTTKSMRCPLLSPVSISWCFTTSTREIINIAKAAMSIATTKIAAALLDALLLAIVVLAYTKPIFYFYCNRVPKLFCSVEDANSWTAHDFIIIMLAFEDDVALHTNFCFWIPFNEDAFIVVIIHTALKAIVF